MVCGMILAGAAFMLAGIVQIQVDVSIGIVYMLHRLYLCTKLLCDCTFIGDERVGLWSCYHT